MRNDRDKNDDLIPKHGGFRRLKTFELATLIYDVTTRFCEKYLDPRSRTVDQMVQSARSGRQNIAEGSVDSGTSKKIELKLTNIAKGSLEELRLDYEDYLRQKDLPQWPPDHPALKRFKARRCATLMEFRLWVADEVEQERRTTKEMKNTEKGNKPQGSTRAEQPTRTDTDKHEPTQILDTTSPGVLPLQASSSAPPDSVPPSASDRADVRASPCGSVFQPESTKIPVFVANGALSLLNLCIYLLGRQVSSLANTFEREGGFTERLYRKRLASRDQQHNQTHEQQGQQNRSRPNPLSPQEEQQQEPPHS